MDENLNTAVLTTKNIFFKNVLISYVFHHMEDCMWEFREDRKVPEDSDFLVVSLEEIIDKDPSVKDILSLPLGFVAYRINISKEWSISKIV
ncbi:MAG: hypothetical protein LBE37_19280 [Sphingobacterium sp.]|jgi:hypothetical protein|nr:hypothetical protein [Sphingobacterium sp.]